MVATVHDRPIFKLIVLKNIDMDGCNVSDWVKLFFFIPPPKEDLPMLHHPHPVLTPVPLH